MNLDKGNYDTVLASPCVNDMQKGAAYFGKAGFDVKDVINRFIDANLASSQSGTASSQSDLNIYMTSLVGHVQDTTLVYLDNAKTNYSAVPSSAENYKDAQFYLSLVDAMKSLALIKIVIPNLVDPNGNLNMSCDLNSNSVPDEADATACALIAAQAISTGITFTCSGATYAPLVPVDITFPTVASAGTTSYSGLTITILNTGGTPTTCSNNVYKRLLYKKSATEYAVATSTEGPCQGSDLQGWPCPIGGANQDLVTTIDSSIFSAVTTLSSAITTTGSDLQTSITQIQTDACKTPCSGITDCTMTPQGPGCPSSCVDPTKNYCSSTDLSTYITTYLK